jgi:hypothetical protein
LKWWDQRRVADTSIARQRFVKALFTSNEETYNSRGTVGSDILYSVGLKVTYRGLTDRETGRASRVEVGSNTSTVAQRVIGGDEKGTQCLGV